MFKLKVGRVFLRHTFARKKGWKKNFRIGGQVLMSIPIEVCKILNMVTLGIFLQWFGRDLFIFKVILKEILHFKVSLMTSNMTFNQ